MSHTRPPAAFPLVTHRCQCTRLVLSPPQSGLRPSIAVFSHPLFFATHVASFSQTPCGPTLPTHVARGPRFAHLKVDQNIQTCQCASRGLCLGPGFIRCRTVYAGLLLVSHGASVLCSDERQLASFCHVQIHARYQIALEMTSRMET